MMKGEVQTDLACPECRRPLAIKSGKNGLFLACTGFPECRHSANFTRDERGNIVVEETPENREDFGVCEKCGRPMIVKRGRFGPFLACSGYPECKNTRGLTRDGSSADGNTIDPGTCKQCGGRMLLKVGRAGQEFFACENYPTCRYTEAKRTDVPCPNEDCPGMLVERRSRKGRRFYACDQYPKCKFAMWDEPFEGVCPECGTKLLRVKYPKNAEPFVGCRSKDCKFKKPLQAALSD
jgi:DNA topoisomerase-1